MNLKICTSLLLILCAVSGMIEDLSYDNVKSPKNKKPVKDKEVSDEDKDVWSQVTVMTWNTDALFDKLASGKDEGQISYLAELLGKQLYDLDPNGFPELVVLHLQEVTSCASASNSIFMALKTTSISVQDSNPKNFKDSNVVKNLQTFGGLLGGALFSRYKIGYICEDIYFFQAIGTIICKRMKFGPPKFEKILETHFGESKDKGHLGFKIGFKGGLVIRARLDNPQAPDLIFVNIHASSKAILDRRRHFLAVFNLAMEEEYGLNAKDEHDKSAIFFFAGDFNARTGTNLEGVTDKTWAKEANILGQRVRECNLPLTDYVIKKGNLGLAYKMLDSAKLKVDGQVCKQVFGLMQDNDEYMTWVKNKPNILNSIYGYDAKKKITGVFSPLQEAPKEFLPSYCLQRGHTTSYGHLEKGGIVHYTDRIFYAVRQSMTDYSIQGIYWSVKPGTYSGHTVDFMSDHGTVFGTYKIESDDKQPDWFIDNLKTNEAFRKQQKKDDVGKYIVSLTKVDPIDQKPINSISDIILGGNEKVRFVRRPRIIHYEEDSIVIQSQAKKQQSQSIVLPEAMEDLILSNVELSDKELEPLSFEKMITDLNEYVPSEDELDGPQCEKADKKKLDEFANRKRSSGVIMIEALTDEQIDEEKNKGKKPGPSDSKDKIIQLRSLLNAPNKII